jgi:hypothetical protein
MISDAALFGLTEAQRMAEEDENANFMYSCPIKDGLDAIEDVARGLRPETTIRFLLARHVVVVGGNEWALDSDLALWRRARAYAEELNHQGLLQAIQGQGELAFQKIVA